MRYGQARFRGGGIDAYEIRRNRYRRQLRSEIREVRNHRIPVGFLQLVAGIDGKESRVGGIPYGKGANRREKRDSRENGFFKIGEFHKGADYVFRF